MDKMRMESVDMTAQNIEKIGALFPNCITETVDENGKAKKAINFELLKQMLSGDVIEGSEAYEFTWVGKKAAIVEANKPIRKTLRPCKEESVNWDTTENLYIEGDNLEVLKLLQESYLGAIKMIYIDPPYNTGSDFIYRDDYKQSTDDYEDELGVYDEDGNRMFKNTDTNGRFHSDWCSMIYSRLMLARNLLADDGVIFISIDDNEFDNLRKMCDEIFGAKNYVANIVWQKKTGASDAINIATITENILVYAKNANSLKLTQNEDAHDSNRYKYKDEYYSERGAYYYDSLDRGTLGYHESLDYPVIAPDGTAVYPNGRNTVLNDGWRWKWGKEKLDWGIKNGFIEVRENKSKGNGWGVYYKIYENVDNDGNVIKRSSPYKNLIQDVLNTHASTEAKEIFGRTDYFSNPKPVKLIKHLIHLGTNDDDIILDFFSGSATTAQAAMTINAEDGMNRKFILVQLPEVLDTTSTAKKAGFDTICDIGKERIRKAGAKIKEDSPLTTANLDTGFRVLKLDDTNMNEVYYAAGDYTQDLLSMLESNVKADRTDLDLLFGCLLEWGLPLSLPYTSKQIEGCTVHTYNDGDLIACFDEDIPDSVIKTIAKKQPLRAVFRDSSFASSPSKINVGEVFKLLAPDTRVKVI
ncbi:MAG: site-specific DNA-methyltransferase [Ruminococcaceae bacterium]|nr:site-specific DNA-methyltransferase [Oscillospiraceae bacterium]